MTFTKTQMEAAARADQQSPHCGEPDWNGLTHDEYSESWKVPCFQQDGDWDWFEIDDYPNDREACHRLIKGMGDTEGTNFILILQRNADYAMDENLMEIDVFRLFCEETPQIFQAICETKGWE